MLSEWKKIFASLKGDQEIEDLYETAKEMMTEAKNFTFQAIDTLRYERGKPISDPKAQDKVINDFEMKIRRDIFMYLAVSQHPAKNHNAALIMSLISHDMERIGDYAKNIFDLTERYSEAQKFGKFDSRLKEVENLISNGFNTLTTHFQNDNEQLQKNASEELTEANEGIKSMLDEVHNNADGTGLSNEEMITLVLYLRFLKRISSHLRNISSSFYAPIDRIGFNPAS